MKDEAHETSPLTILCLASYFKGEAFLQECRRQKCSVLLVTLESLAGAAWPRNAIDEFFYMPALSNRDDVIKGISYLARTRRIDRIVPLDDYDLEMAAVLREHLRVPGMGDTTTRHFRDKLAMRVKAREGGIAVPEFVHVLNRESIRHWISRVPPPWVLKPRSEAASIGIRKVSSGEELWPCLDDLGDRQSFYLLEQFIPGDVYHVDSIVSERQVLFSVPHKYGHPPMEVAHEGGIFTTRNLEPDSDDAGQLDGLNRRLVASLGLVRGVTHTEFIRGSDDKRFYFLESAARVGGAFITDLVAAATGINLWVEWAKIEIAGADRPYILPRHRYDFAGLILSLARQEEPDTSAFDDPEVVVRIRKPHHAGLIVVSRDSSRIAQLLEAYSRRFRDEFLATLPLPDRPTG